MKNTIYLLVVTAFILIGNYPVSASDNSDFIYNLSPQRVLKGYKNKTRWLAINTTGKQTNNKYLDSFEIITIPLIRTGKVNTALWNILIKTISKKDKKVLLFYAEDEKENIILKSFLNGIHNDLEGYEFIFIDGGIKNFSNVYNEMKIKEPDFIKKAEDHDCGC
jgi:hypothetical protein